MNYSTNFHPIARNWNAIQFSKICLNIQNILVQYFKIKTNKNINLNNYNNDSNI